MFPFIANPLSFQMWNLYLVRECVQHVDLVYRKHVDHQV